MDVPPTSRRGGRRANLFDIPEEDVDDALVEANEDAPVSSVSQLKSQHSASAWWKSFLRKVGKSVEAGSHIPSSLVMLWVKVSLEEHTNNSSFRGPEFSMLTIRDTYTPALLQWFDKEGYTYDKGLRNQVRLKVAAMMKAGKIGLHQQPVQVGSNPICTWDIERLVKHLPVGWRRHADVLAWCVIGHHLGQRGISLVNIRWSDLVISAVAHEGTADPMVQINVTLRVGKGRMEW